MISALAVGWMNKDVPAWLRLTDRFETVRDNIRNRLGWQ